MEKPGNTVLKSMLTFMLAVLDGQASIFGGRVVGLICDTKDGTSVVLSPALNEAEQRILMENLPPAIRKAASEVEGLKKGESQTLM